MDGKGRWIDNVFIERLWRSEVRGGLFARVRKRHRSAQRLDPVLQFLQRRSSASVPRVPHARRGVLPRFGQHYAGGGLKILHYRPRVQQVDFPGYRGSGYPKDRRSCSVIRRRIFHTEIQKPGTRASPAAARDCAAGRGLTKSEDEETIIINRPDRSTYPDEKSVLTSGATPYFASAGVFWHRSRKCLH